mgnify:FL=1
MDVSILYHRIKAEEFRLQEFKALASKAANPEIQTAYSVIGNIHLSTMTGLQTEMVSLISTLSAPLKPKAESEAQPDKS